MKNTVPIVVQVDSSQSYWVKNIFSGLSQSAEKGDYVLEFINGSEQMSRVDYPYNNGSVLVIGYTDDWLKTTICDLVQKGFAPILVNSWLSPAMLKVCSGVCFDLKESVENAVQYLISAGRSNIAMLGINNRSLADILKKETFERVMGEQLPENEINIFDGSNSLCERIDEFIGAFVEKDIDAVICANDTVAIYLINRMMKDGFNIPEDLYIIGMGNSKLGQKISMPLSTIDFDYEELGRQALRLWRYLQKGKSDIHAEISIPCRFIARLSTESFATSDKKFTGIDAMLTADGDMQTNADEFYEDVDVQRIIEFEVFLRTCDELDYRVLEEMLRGRSDSRMADMLNISDRAIRYRINKMTKKLGVQSREDVLNIIRDLRAFEQENKND